MVRIASQASVGSAQWFASAIRKSMSSPLLCVRNRAFVDVDAGEFHPRMRPRMTCRFRPLLVPTSSTEAIPRVPTTPDTQRLRSSAGALASFFLW
jgi:hypothetical protein